MATRRPELPSPRVGIVGAGRTRQGLGPFLAKWFESAGAEVVGVSGRDAARAEVAAADLGRQLGREVVAFADAQSLAARVDLLVVACPVEGHLAGLEAAAAAGVACLCEKPLVGWRDAARGLAAVDVFRRRGLLLAENCQWPYTLPALDALHPEVRARPVRSLVMRLSPAWPGPTMVEDSLSHALSLLQALAPLPLDAELGDVSQTDGSEGAQENVVRFAVRACDLEVSVELQLRCCASQPRPAWFAVDGVRLDRRIGPDYQISFECADGRVANVQDPLAALVYGLVADLQRAPRERTDAIADAIALRLRLYAGVLERLRGAAG